MKNRSIGEVLGCPEEGGEDGDEVEDAEPGVGDLAVGCEEGDEGGEGACCCWFLLGFGLLGTCWGG